MDRAFSILPKILRQRGLSDAAYSGLVLERAMQWIKQELPECAASLHPLQVKDAVLIVEGTHSIAVAECSGRCQELQIYLTSTLPEIPLKSIRVVRARA